MMLMLITLIILKVVNSNTFKYKNKITGNTYNVNAGVNGYNVNKNGTQEIELLLNYLLP